MQAAGAVTAGGSISGSGSVQESRESRADRLHRMKSMFVDPVTHEATGPRTTDASTHRHAQRAVSRESSGAEDEGGEGGEGDEGETGVGMGCGGIVGLSWESDASVLDKVGVILKTYT